MGVLSGGRRVEEGRERQRTRPGREPDAKERSLDCSGGEVREEPMKG